MFSLPGLAVLRSISRQPGVHAVAVAMLLGVAASCVAIAIAGSVIDHFSLAFVAALIVLVTVAMRFAAAAVRSGTADGVSPAPTFSGPWGVGVAALALLLAAVPLSGAGFDNGDGLIFRSFFNADFFKHLGIAGAFAQGHLPPFDPFGAGERLHYYWLQHLIPATALAIGGGDLSPVRVLTALGLVQTTVLVLALHGVATRLSGSARAAAVAVGLGIASLSWDGLAVGVEFMRAAAANASFDINMERLSITTFLGAPSHISASTLFRLNLYIPQHQLCLAFFLAWAYLELRGSGIPALRFALLAALPATSVLLGYPLLAVALATMAWRHWQERSRPCFWSLMGAAVGMLLPPALGMIEANSAGLWLEANRGADSSAGLGSRLLWFAPQWIASFGGLALLALWAPLRRAGAAPGMALALLLLLLPTLLMLVAEVWPGLGHLRVDIQLKASFAIGAGLAMLAAVSLRHMPARSATFLVLITLALGLPSLLHDLLWHACPGPHCQAESRQGTFVPAGDVAALTAMRTTLPAQAIVQQWPEPDYLAGGHDVWTPVLGGHAIRYSRRGSNVTPEQIEAARQLFDPERAAASGREARKLRIDYLYLSRSITPVYYEALQTRYSHDPDLRAVYIAHDASIWQVSR